MGLFGDGGGFFGVGPSRILDPFNMTGLDTSAQDANSAQAAQYAANAPRPTQIQWQDIYNPNTMADTATLDQSGIKNFQQLADRQGPSDWANQATAQQGTLAHNALDMGAKSVAGQGATARSQLAQRGGLSGGAAERVATEGQNNYLNMAQGVNQQKTTNIQQIGMNDAQNKMQEMSMVPGMQLGAANFASGVQQFNTQAQMANNSAENTFNLGQYQAQMAAYGAGQTAQATQNAGKHKK